MKELLERSEAKILLVDDSDASRLALEGILERLGHVLVPAQSGREALRRLLEEDEFALILLDVQMPEMDGFETARLVRARPSTRHIPIIFITAMSREREHLFRGYERGAVDYILKPFEPDILRSKVEVFVELWRRGERIRWQEEALREREREALARRAEHRFRELIDAMPLCVWAATPRGRIIHCNRVFLEYVGRTPEECALGGGFLDVHRNERDQVERVWAEAVATGRAFEVQFRLRRAGDGSYRWQLGRGAPNRDERGRVAGWIFAATDVDTEKRGEEMRQLLLAQERQARGAAEEAMQAKDQFLATLSHELRTPLTVILGWTQLLRGGKLGPEAVPRAVDVIERNAKAQAALVNDLLDVSGIVSGKMRLEVQPGDPFAVVAAGVDAMRPAAAAKGVALSFTEESPRAAFACDPSRLQQVVWNLVSNAVKFTPAGGHIAVRAALRDGALEIEVRDDGIGIPPEFLPHVFERFSQAAVAGSRRGLGLGLAIVRHLIELHGGTVDVSSEGKGKGTTFTVRLPAAASVQPLPAEPNRLERAAHVEDVHVLLVEDDRDALEFFASVLNGSGARVVTASNTEEALRVFEREPPQVLVCDLGLPGEDGCALLKRLRALPPERGGAVPAAAITAYAAAEDRRRAMAAGFQRHIAKPFDPAELPALVAELARSAPARSVRADRAAPPGAEPGQALLDSA